MAMGALKDQREGAARNEGPPERLGRVGTAVTAATIADARAKQANIITYLQEELTDARVRCDQLLRYVDKAAKLVQKSQHKDHLFEVAGDLIQGIPETSFKLHKALQAVALAANRIDYEEIKQDLRPEKTEELERVLKDVRIRQVHRRGAPMSSGSAPTRTNESTTRSAASEGQGMLNPGKVVEQLKGLAKRARADGRLDTDGLSMLIASLERGAPKVATDAGDKVASQLEAMAHALENPPAGEMPSRVRLAQVLRKTYAEHVDVTAAGKLPKEIRNEFEASRMMIKKIMDGQGNPRRHTQVVLGCLAQGLALMGQQDLSEVLIKAVHKVVSLWSAADMNDYDESNLKQAGDWTVRLAAKPSDEAVESIQEAIESLKKLVRGTGSQKRVVYAALRSLRDASEKMNQDEAIINLLERTAAVVKAKWKDDDAGAEAANKNASGDDEKLSRYEEGKSADPTKNMSEADAKEWKANTEEHGDKFKKDAKGDLTELMLPTALPTLSPVDAAVFVEEAIFGLKRLQRMLNGSASPGGITRTFKEVLTELGSTAWNLNLPSVSALLNKATLTLRVKNAGDADDGNGDNESGNDGAVEKKANIDAEPRDLEELDGALEELMQHARMTKMTGSQGNYKKMFFNLMKVLGDVYNVTNIFGIPGTGFLVRVVKAIMPYGGARPMMNFAARLEVASDDEKLSRFEEGKSADPTKKMSPEDAKEWKANTEEHKDNFKAAGARWAVDSMSAGEWYVQKFDSRGDMYFLAQTEQKNGGWAGILVDPENRMKATKNSVPKSHTRQWKKIEESSLPPKVKSWGESKTAAAPEESGTWKVARKIPAPDDGSIIEEIMSWHGGQGTNLYSVGSMWNSGRDVDADDAEEAYDELKRKHADHEALEAFEDHLSQHGVKVAGRRRTPSASVDAWKAA
jgi:hypothetical protein